MDRRAEPRDAVDREGWLSGARGLASRTRLRILNLSSRGMRIALEARVEPGSTVEIEAGDALFLGEVVYCEPLGDGFAAGVRVEHALMGVLQLQAQARQFMADNNDYR